ncbi:putative threonine efflux protein [Vibrio tapetis subsp. tapetis]|uniref:Putative threonine efflux protein n=1 Tax=Vibrio tapetis subsp. tapetis TaxID=1671868 RepID=A0A2N8ZB77_9VIBR|nr:putative threonine efflux protein [Vibrio tapetis subsp. tapetis]
MEHFSLALLGLLIVISPGADFVLVLRNSINHGRTVGLWTAAGVSTAICIHISYSMLGISYLISQNDFLFSTIRYSGAAYLIYLGWKGIYTASASMPPSTNRKERANSLQFFGQGFLCNVLNPKTMLFFLSIFSQVISVEATNNDTALVYGLYMVALHGIWFCIVLLQCYLRQTH